MAFRLLGHVLLLASILILASSAVSDPVQALVRSGVDETLRRADGAVHSTTLNMRAALLRHTAMRPDGVRDLSQDDLVVLFGPPSLKRREGPVTTWQFASGECALDVYFKENALRPVYAEYRVRGSAEGKAPVAMLDHRACVKSLFIRVK